LWDMANILHHSKSNVRPIWVSTHDQLADIHTRLGINADAEPQFFGDIPSSFPLVAPSWPSLIRPLVATPTFRTTTSSDVPLGILPTGI
jgi:hypothetical protein